MLEPIRTIRVNHLNIVLEDYDATIDHFQRLFDSTVILDLPKDLWHACLVDVGRTIFELFAPHDFFLHTRYGPHHIGVEYQVEDLDHARDVIASRGIRVARELDVALHSHPADCHGVSLELYGGYFHDNPDILEAPMRPAEHWRDVHPLGLTELKAYTVVVDDLATGLADFQAVFAHEVAYEEARPRLGATAVGLRSADAGLELLAPDGDGPLRQDLIAHGEGIRSTVFGVRSIDQARSYFADLGIDLVPGTAPGALAIPVEANRGVLFEFAE